MKTFQIQLVTTSISLLYLALWSTAASGKWRSLTVPDWFIKQFEPTWIAQVPRGVWTAYWLIAMAELVLAVAFFASLFWSGILPWALIGSLFMFVILIMGLRLSFDFQGSANMYIYFAATLLCFWFLQYQQGVI